MAGRPTAFLAVGLLSAGLLLPACERDSGGGGAPGARADGPGERCFASLRNEAPGRLRLTSPVACSTRDAHYRVEGDPQRPRQVLHLDDQGRLDMRLELTWSPEGRALAEERVLYPGPQPLKVFDRGQRWEFRFPGGDPLRPVRIRNELDEQGRPLRTSKWVGDRLEFRVERSYQPDGSLLREVTTDGEGGVRVERRFSVENGKRIERMLDGGGKLLLEREAPPEPTSGTLDNAPSSPVQDVPSSD